MICDRGFSRLGSDRPPPDWLTDAPEARFSDDWDEEMEEEQSYYGDDPEMQQFVDVFLDRTLAVRLREAC
jgi:hypothetical protein